MCCPWNGPQLGPRHWTACYCGHHVHPGKLIQRRECLPLPPTPEPWLGHLVEWGSGDRHSETLRHWRKQAETSPAGAGAHRGHFWIVWAGERGENILIASLRCPRHPECLWHCSFNKQTNEDEAVGSALDMGKVII